MIRSGMFIPDLDLDFLPIPDPGVKKAPDPDPDPQHCVYHLKVCTKRKFLFVLRFPVHSGIQQTRLNF
jgi:hypothetical protein